MSAGAEQRLHELGVTLPDAPVPVAAYVPAVRGGDLIYVSGQLPLAEGVLIASGKLGGAVGIEAGLACARQCGVNALAQLRAELGSLDRVVRVLRIGVFVAGEPDFTEQHVVADGASELLAEVFGDTGRHARTAVGTPSLPMDAPVEVEALVLAS